MSWTISRCFEPWWPWELHLLQFFIHSFIHYLILSYVIQAAHDGRHGIHAHARFDDLDFEKARPCFLIQYFTRGSTLSSWCSNLWYHCMILLNFFVDNIKRFTFSELAYDWFGWISLLLHFAVVFVLNWLQPNRIEVQEVDFNPEFITKLLPKLDFTALRQAATQVGVLPALSTTLLPKLDFTA